MVEAAFDDRRAGGRSGRRGERELFERTNKAAAWKAALPGNCAWEYWLSGMDSNHDKSLQRALCYHYTTGQTANRLTFRDFERKGKLSGMAEWAEW